MDAGLKWFTRIWVGLVILFNIAGIVGYAVTAQSIGDLVDWVQQTYSPFNIWNHALNLFLLSPAMISYFWRKRRNEGDQFRTRSLAQEKRDDLSRDIVKGSSARDFPPNIGDLEPEKIVSDFGSIIENLDYMSSFHDLSKLPYTKQEISGAIIQSYKTSSDEKIREVLKIGLLALSHFQENIGDSPVQSAVDLTQINIEELSPEDFLAMNAGIDENIYEQLSQTADREYQGYIELL